MTLERWRIPFEPAAAAEAIVAAGPARFTVLTSRLLRLEFSWDGEFEDRPSQTFWYRRQPVPSFAVRRLAERIEIETEHLLLRYEPNDEGFSASRLAITLKETGATWSVGEQVKWSGNLGGTVRTLDGIDGRVRLDPGLISRQGWAVVDDSGSLVFDEDGWITLRRRPESLDLTFFGYGSDYVACLQDYQKIAGGVPLIPRWVLGNWWSRYWAYTQAELQELMKAFEARGFPLAVCIVDMDWHITQTGNRASGWTGYTWNRALFPDPAGFMGWLHERGLKTALNLHPAEGVHPHEEAYQPMAAALGLDPDSGEPIPFDIADPAFVEAYFRFLHHPLEAQGVDFWWIDWQQGTRSRLAGLDPLTWLNHLHFYDLGRSGEKRPLIFSRWGGLGSHRYPIGFSGDTVVSWASLAFQPEFTATAANVAYGWWSHDIGGHMWGIEEGELYLRWVQFGVFSPVLRLHSSNNPYSERRPWGWGGDVERIARAALQLRHALIPYLYTMAWRNEQEGLPPITPLYYTHPQAEEGYDSPQAYWFGSQLLAAPITAPAEADLGLAQQRLWLPPGRWYNFFTGEPVAAGWHELYADLNGLPVFAPAGGIIPMGPAVGWGGLDNPETLVVHCFAGRDNRFVLYEDDGETTAYLKGEFALTTIEQSWEETRLLVTITPPAQLPAYLPAGRRWRLHLWGIVTPEEIDLTAGGRAAAPSAVVYDAEREALAVSIDGAAAGEVLRLAVGTSGPALLAGRDRRGEAVRQLLRAFRLDTQVKAQIDGDLPRLLRGEGDLLRYALSPGQRRALAEVLAGRASVSGRFPGSPGS